jgi:hypothetical protein
MTQTGEHFDPEWASCPPRSRCDQAFRRGRFSSGDNFTEQEYFRNLIRILIESGNAAKVRMDGHLIWGRYGNPSFRA